MPVSWFLLSLALGRNPVVLSLERVVGLQDAARCSPGLSCHLWDGDVLCLPGSIVSAPGPVLVPTRLQTELVLRCHEETDCDLCVRVVIHLAVHGSWEEPEDEEKFGGAADAELEEHGNASLQAHVVLSFQAYPTARCVLLEVQVPAALVQPGQPVGSVVFDCFEAALGAEVRIWSYTQPRYQKELNLTQQLPALPWLNVSADGEDVRLVLDVSEEQRFGLSLYWNQAQGPAKPWWHRNLTGPQTITLNHTDLVPCLCIQVWPLEPDSVRTSICPFREDPRAHRNLWRAARLHLLPPQGWRLDAPCSLPAEATLCWQALDGGPCQPLVPPLPRENITVNKALEFPLLKGHPNICIQVNSWETLQLQECLWADSLGPLKDDMLLVETRGPQDNRSLCALEASGCTPLLSRASTRAARLGEQLLQDLQSGQCLQLWDDDLGALWACPMDKYVHQRWALVWLACLLLAAVLFLLLLLKKNHVKAAARSRAALLLYSADDAGFERRVGAVRSWPECTGQASQCVWIF
nr:interleukin-17 receptor C isoform X6 [Vicugna pacos]